MVKSQQNHDDEGKVVELTSHEGSGLGMRLFPNYSNKENREGGI